MSIQEKNVLEKSIYNGIGAESNDSKKLLLLQTLLSIYLPPVIIFIGTVGNILSLAVFFKLCKLKLVLPQNVIFKLFKHLTKSTDSKDKGIFQELKENNCELNEKNTKLDSIINFKNKDKTLISSGILTMYFYLSVLALFDLGVLYFGLFNDWIYDLTNFNFKHLSTNWCKCFTFIAFLFSHFGSFLIVITSFIRFMGFYSPFKTAQLTKMNNLKPFLLAVLLVFTLLNAHFFWTMNLVVKDQNKELLKSLNGSHLYDAELLKNLSQIFPTHFSLECRIEETRFGRIVWPIIDKLLYSLIPFFLIFFFNLLIIINLIRSQDYRHVVYIFNMRFSGQNENEKTLRETTSLRNNNKSNLMSARFYNNTNDNNKSESTSAKSKENMIEKKIKELKNSHLFGKRFTLMLLGLSFTFLVLTLPSVLFIVLIEPIEKHIESLEHLHESNRSYEWLSIAQRIAILFMYMNHSINFFIYYFTGARFRKQFHSMFSNRLKRFALINTLFRILFERDLKQNSKNKNSNKNGYYLKLKKRPSLYA